LFIVSVKFGFSCKI